MMNTNIFKIGMYFLIAMTILLLGVLNACNDREGFGPDDAGESSMSVKMRSSNIETFINNTNIYMFTDAGNFVEKKLNVNRNLADNTLTTNVKVGRWDIVLLTCDQDISGNITVPAPTSPMAGTPMWVTKPDVGGNYLSQTPSEFRYVMLPDVDIVKDVTTQVSTLMYRNVTKIQVILKQYEGFDPITPSNIDKAYAELLEVPTTLAWNGNLYPNRFSPTTSTLPMREYLSFQPNGAADTLNFYVPAHRGDAIIESGGNWVEKAAPTDTTTHMLKLRMSMPLGGVEYNGRSTNGIEIPYAPKPNRIIQVLVTFYGTTTLDIKVGVKPWDEWIIQNEEFN